MTIQFERQLRANRGLWHLFLLLVLGVIAQSTPVYAAMDYRRVTTQAGLTFYYRHDTTTPYAALHFAWKSSYVAAHPGKEGLLGLAPHLLLAASDNDPRGPLSERLKDEQASANFGADMQSVAGNVRAPAQRLAAAAAIMSELFTAPLPDKVFNRLKGQLTKLAEQAELQPTQVAQKSLLYLLLGNSPLTRATRLDRFANLTLADVNVWRQHVLRREGLYIGVSGALTETEASAIVDATFAALPKLGSPADYEWPNVAFRARTVVVETATPQTIIAMAGKTTVGHDLGSLNGFIGNAVLGGGADGRLFAKVRGELGATYHVTSSLSPVQPKLNMLWINTAVAPEKSRDVLVTIRKAHAEWQVNGLVEAELAPTKARLANAARQVERDPSTANGRLLANYLLRDVDVANARTYFSRLDSATLPIVNAYLRKVMPPPEGMMTVIVAASAVGFNADCVIKSLAEIDRCR